MSAEADSNPTLRLTGIRLELEEERIVFIIFLDLVKDSFLF